MAGNAFSMGRFGLGPPLAQRIYDAMIAGLNEQLDTSEGGHLEATCFAEAKGLARTQRLLDHAARQRIPRWCLENLAAMEEEYGIIPGPLDTVAERRAVFAARKLLPLGNSRVNVELALGELLGDDFLAYRTTEPSEIATFPLGIGDDPMNLQLPTVPRKLVRLLEPISVDIGIAQAVQYEALAVPAVITRFGLVNQATILAGDVLVVEPEIEGQTERVTVTATGNVFPGGEQAAIPTFTAVFLKSHEPGAIGTTQPWPHWESNQRDALIVLTSTAARDPETRRRVHNLMERIARGVSAWAIVASTGTGTAGPLTLDSSPLDATPLGTVTY